MKKFLKKLKNPKSQSLSDALKKAIRLCKDGNEEKGGFILRKGNSYQFVHVLNSNTGTPIAHGLYTADKVEFGKKVLKLIMTAGCGWSHYASFHTHPNGYASTPSNIDLYKLFTGFNINYIYATQQKELVRYKKVDVSEVSGSFFMDNIQDLFFTVTPNGQIIWKANNVKLKQ